MLKNLLHKSSITLIALMLAACGGARNPALDEIISIPNASSISWQSPTLYEDQTPLLPSKIGGYQVLVGTNLENMRLKTNIDDPTVTEFSLSSLNKGIYFIAVSCYDVDGVESNLSSIIQVNIY